MPGTHPSQQHRPKSGPPYDKPKSAVAWIRRHFVSILAAVAALGILTSWVLDVFVGLKPIGTFPVGYDLCLAYLIGWLFHLLVVVIPERRKVRAIMQTLSGNLMTIANNGADLIHDLEFLGGCPQRPITEDHVLKVCTANNYSDSMQMFMSMRLSVARDAYRRVTPFLGSLPHDIAVAVQEVDQQFLNVSFEVPDHLKLWSDDDPNGPSLELQEICAPHTFWLTTAEGPVCKRQTLKGWNSLIFKYYVSTERVLAAVRRFPKGTAGHSESVDFWFSHRLNMPGPIMDYPMEASSDAGTSTPPEVP